LSYDGAVGSEGLEPPPSRVKAGRPAIERRARRSGRLGFFLVFKTQVSCVACEPEPQLSRKTWLSLATRALESQWGTEESNLVLGEQVGYGHPTARLSMRTPRVLALSRPEMTEGRQVSRAAFTRSS
jgi:hypothetical protein